MNPAIPREVRDLYARHRAALAPIWDPQVGLTVGVRVPASVALAPDRTRCRACRKGFGDLVVLRMYCSYRCAGLPAPDPDPETAPRVCKRAARSDEPGRWVFKQRFDTAAEAARFLKPGLVLYRCRSCWACHLGNVSTPPAQAVPIAAHTGDRFTDCVHALLQARGEDPGDAAAVAAAKRDVRAVLAVLDATPPPRR